jgi:hypothetical protein
MYDVRVQGKMPYWEGQSYGVLPPGTNPKNGKPNSVRLYSIASSRYAASFDVPHACLLSCPLLAKLYTCNTASVHHDCVCVYFKCVYTSSRKGNDCIRVYGTELRCCCLL